MAVNDVDGLIALTAGVSMTDGEIHVRGGRTGEVVYSVDGMSVSDPVDGGAALSVDTDAIKDMNVMTGGFTAEYGNAQSGIVSIVTKDGDRNYTGKFEYVTDHLLSSENSNMDLLRFAFGGPVLGYNSGSLRDAFTFFINGSGSWTDGRFKDSWKSDPNDAFIFNGESLLSEDIDYPEYDPYSDRKDFLWTELGDRNYNSYNVNFKTKYQINPRSKVTLAVRGDREINDAYSHGSQYALQHAQRGEVNQRQYVVNFDQIFNSQMNLKIKASYYNKTSKYAPKGVQRDSYINQYIYSEDLYNEDGSFNEENFDTYLNSVYTNVEAIGAGWDTIAQSGDIMWGYPDSEAWVYTLPSTGDNRSIPFTAPGTISDSFVDDETTTYSMKADYEYRINDVHQAKTGLEVIQHKIVKDQLADFLTINVPRMEDYLQSVYDPYAVGSEYEDLNPADDAATIPDELYYVEQVDTTGVVSDDYLFVYTPEDYYAAAYAASGVSDGYKASPLQAAYYLQDRMEWEGMIVNLGIRADYWYLGTGYQKKVDDGSYEEVTFVDSLGYKKSDLHQLMLSPRLGVSHPISERDVLRFAYNYQNQLPPMAYIFTSRTADDANTSSGITVGNPKLEPQITVTYEVGLTHQMSDDYVIDVTTYYKNIYNYVSTKKVYKQDEEQVFWYEYLSHDYGSARGVDISLTKFMSNFWTGSLAYSLAWAEGNSSATIIQDYSTNLREFPLDWDIRHDLKVNLTFRIDDGEEFIIPGTSWILPFDDFSTNFSWGISSARPYTPVSESNTSLDTNSERMDPMMDSNLRISKGWSFGKKDKRVSVRAYCDVSNLFKYNNISTVYPKTGNPNWDGNEDAITTEGVINPQMQYMRELAIDNPSYENNERRITLGVAFNF
jgi:outer membrane receptor protein involved in Fe transport